MYANLRIDQIDMHIRDERAFAILKEHADDAGHSAVNVTKLAEILKCSRRTATAITNRLQAAGYIIKHCSAGRGGADIEVLS